MASGGKSDINNDTSNELSQKVDKMLSIMTDMKATQEGMKRTLESKIDSLRNEMMKNIDSKLKSLRNEIALDINKETSRIDALFESMKELQERMKSVEDGNCMPRSHQV